MAYTTIDKPSDYFNTVTWTGDDTTSRAISGVGFQPDWTWIKGRSLSVSHLLQDVVRGTGGSYTLKSDSTGVNGTNTQGNVSAFSTDGFTVAEGSDGDHTRAVNNGSATYVGWNWKAGTSFTNDASSTGIGSIDSAGSVSTDAGFSIIRWSGTGSNATIAHGLGSAPKMMIIKRITGGTEQWIVYHQAISPAKHLFLNLTDAENADTNNFQNTATTSSVFSVGTYNQMNASGTNNMIAYCFAEKKGYSKFGSYTGNGNADGTFIYTGFKPAFIIVKNTSSSTNWEMFDNKRVGYNPGNWHLKPNSSDAEDVGTVRLDILSNGFKIRTTGSNLNTSGNNYIYMAFAENPFVTSTGVPATAR